MNHYKINFEIVKIFIRSGFDFLEILAGTIPVLFQVCVTDRNCTRSPDQYAISEFPGPLYQNEVKCSASDKELIFHSHADKKHFHKKGCAPGGGGGGGTATYGLYRYVPL